MMPCSIENEIGAWRLIDQAATATLKGYSTSILEDIQLLKDQNLTTNQRNCIIYRKSEKEILQYL
jgi:protein-histidine N-methyltransferase